MYNHNKAQQSKNRVHISWDILYVHYWMWDATTPKANGRSAISLQISFISVMTVITLFDVDVITYSRSELDAR